jgi:hypothetical protein
MNIQSTAATSGTVTSQDTQQDLTVVHDAGATATLTITMPSSPTNGQIFCVSSVGGIVALTLNSAITIVSTLTSLSVGGNGTWMYISSSNKWVKIK